MSREMTEPDLDAELKIGDVFISPRGLRYTVTHWSPKGKLVAVTEEGREVSWWWRYRGSMAKHWKLERNGTVIL